MARGEMRVTRYYRDCEHRLQSQIGWYLIQALLIASLATSGDFLPLLALIFLSV